MSQKPSDHLMIARMATLCFAALLLAACGRAGAPLRPEPGVVIMKEDAKAAPEGVEDKPFVLDPLL
jgi:hypothetical protein